VKIAISIARPSHDGFTRGGIITVLTRTIEQDMKTTPDQGDDDRVLLRRLFDYHLKGIKTGINPRRSNSLLHHERARRRRMALDKCLAPAANPYG